MQIRIYCSITMDIIHWIRMKEIDKGMRSQKNASGSLLHFLQLSQSPTFTVFAPNRHQVRCTILRDTMALTHLAAAFPIPVFSCPLVRFPSILAPAFLFLSHLVLFCRVPIPSPVVLAIREEGRHPVDRRTTSAGLGGLNRQ